MHPPLPPNSTRLDRNKADAEIDLNSAEARTAISFLKKHGTVIDPTIALYEFLTATTAKPPSSFGPGVIKVAPELAKQLTDVGPASKHSELMEKVFEKGLDIISALHRDGIPIVAGTDQTVPGYSRHREIEVYAQAGFSVVPFRLACALF
jgi:hypothetical protein